MACEGCERGRDSTIRTGSSTAAAIRSQGLALIRGMRGPVNRETGCRFVGCDHGPAVEPENFPGSSLSSPQLERFVIEQLPSGSCRKFKRTDSFTHGAVDKGSPIRNQA